MHIIKTHSQEDLFPSDFANIELGKFALNILRNAQKEIKEALLEEVPNFAKSRYLLLDCNIY